MKEESDEELEELNEFFEPRKNILSSGNEAALQHRNCVSCAVRAQML
jgi:hypothetical protein